MVIDNKNFRSRNEFILRNTNKFQIEYTITCRYKIKNCRAPNNIAKFRKGERRDGL